MAAKEQLTAMEMIWGFMSGTTGHMGKTDFAPQKEAFGDFASPETYFPRVVPESEGISSEKLTQMLRELAAARHTDASSAGPAEWTCHLRMQFRPIPQRHLARDVFDVQEHHRHGGRFSDQ